MLITIGNSLLVLGFLAMGPLSRLELFSSLWVTVASMGVQGVGVSMVYIGSLLTMMGALTQFGLPETEQSKGMVSSIWSMGMYFGSAIGTVGGSLAYDFLGFENGMILEAGIIVITIIAVLSMKN